MISLLSAAGFGIGVFAVTNVDDLCVLTAFFADHRILRVHIRRYRRIALPFVLIALGLNVLYGARALLLK